MPSVIFNRELLFRVAHQAVGASSKQAHLIADFLGDKKIQPPPFHLKNSPRKRGEHECTPERLDKYCQAVQKYVRQHPGTREWPVARAIHINNNVIRQVFDAARYRGLIREGKSGRSRVWFAGGAR